MRNMLTGQILGTERESIIAPQAAEGGLTPRTTGFGTKIYAICKVYGFASNAEILMRLLRNTCSTEKTNFEIMFAGITLIGAGQGDSVNVKFRTTLRHHFRIVVAFVTRKDSVIGLIDATT